MKTKMIMLAAAFALTQTAFAQTTSTTAAPTATSTATSDAASAAPAYNPVLVKYLGYLFGPGLEMNGAQKDGATYQVQHRVSLGYRLNANTELGVQTRTKQYFGSGTDFKTAAGDWRLFANFKNVLKDDVYNLTLTPRVLMPTSNGSRNEKVAPSPDLIAELAIAPKNTRFSFDTGVEYIHYLHTDGSFGSDYTDAITAQFAPWIEVDYQVSDKVQAMLSWWPIANAYARRNEGMSTLDYSKGDSNEIDAGAYVEIAKGWQLNPYLAIEPDQMDVGSASKNIQINMLIIGTIL